MHRAEHGAPLAGARAYRFLPPFFFAPLAAFLAISYPPFRSWDSACEGLSLPIAAPRPSGTPACFCQHPVASLLTSADAEGLHQQIGGVTRHPRSAQRRELALLAALFLRALCSLFRHSSSLECGSSASLTIHHAYNRWAERSTLIQDVDYG